MLLARSVAALGLIAVTCLVGSGCSSKSDATAPPPPEPAAGCNPLNGDDCLTPFPSSFFLQPDATTSTGVRVNIAPGLLPLENSGIPLSPERLNRKDGFSPATPFIVYFEGGVDATQFFSWRDPTPSLSPTSVVQVINFATGERVPAFAEVDDNVSGSSVRRALIIRPLKRLEPSTRYVIALVGVKDRAGKPVVRAPFAALRDGTTLSAALKPWKASYDEIFGALEKAGVARSSLSLAWDVTTASDATQTGHLVQMRDDAFAKIDAGQLTYAITSSTDSTDTHLLRQILATVKVPWYLADTSGKSMMTFDADGNPVANQVVDVPIVINIPRCAETATAPVPTVVFGHGLFGTAKDTLSGAPAMAAGDAFCKLFIGTDWIGLAAEDVKVLPDLLSADLNNFYVLSDRLQQAHLNAQVMTRLFLRTIKDDPALVINGHPVTDGKEVYYFGVSDGGIQGTTFMALTPDVERGVLNVPGGEWSLMLYRSADLGKFGGLLQLVMPDALDRQVTVAATQSEWDYTDSITYAPHLLRNPLPGVSVKRILVQESLGDAQVPNVSTRLLARTMEIPAYDPIDPVPGLSPANAPCDSAYTQWNSGKTPLPPEDNTALPSDNGAHDSVWKSDMALQQIGAFMTPTGQITDVCKGPCVLP